jgi:hypothetical protein
VFADERDFGRIVSIPLPLSVSVYGLSSSLNVKLLFLEERTRIEIRKGSSSCFLPRWKAWSPVKVVLPRRFGAAASQISVRSFSSSVISPG